MNQTGQYEDERGGASGPDDVIVDNMIPDDKPAEEDSAPALIAPVLIGEAAGDETPGGDIADGGDEAARSAARPATAYMVGEAEVKAKAEAYLEKLCLQFGLIENGSDDQDDLSDFDQAVRQTGEQGVASGFPLMAVFADSLRQYLAGRAALSGHDRMAVQFHLQGMRAILREDVTDDAGHFAVNLSALLGELRDKMSRSGQAA